MADYDVVIIGSGYGGAIPAMRLAEAGMSVLVLERGPRIGSADLEQSDDTAYLQTITDYLITSQNILYRTGALVGGASITMDGAHFRMPQASFEVTDTTGRRFWPEAWSRAALDPYYQLVETMLRVRQFPWREIPKGGGLFAKMLDTVGASCERARMNYTDCLQCGYCAQGCIYDKKQTLLHNYIPAAEAASAEILAGATVDHIEPSSGGYTVVYERAGEPYSVVGERVIVAGGGLHTPALMLRSAPHLPDLSEHVGRHFNNNGEHGFLGILPPEFDDLERYWVFMGMENAGMMSYHWYDSDGFTLHPGTGFEPTVFAGDLTAPGHPVLPPRSWGLEYKRFVEAVYPHRLIGFSTLGLAPSHQDVVLRRGAIDLAGRDRTAYDAYLDRVEVVMAELEHATGVTLVPSVPREQVGMTSAHLLAACRMAERAEDGVVDADGRVFGYENLYICDASAVPYAIAVNPALTIGALAERTAEAIIERG
jgi:enediyne biosynthesis protein E9